MTVGSGSTARLCGSFATLIGSAAGSSVIEGGSVTLERLLGFPMSDGTSMCTVSLRRPPRFPALTRFLQLSARNSPLLPLATARRRVSVIVKAPERPRARTPTSTSSCLLRAATLRSSRTRSSKLAKAIFTYDRFRPALTAREPACYRLCVAQLILWHAS